MPPVPSLSFAAELQSEFGELLNVGMILRCLLRIACALLLGGLLGYERARAGKDAGPRTYMLVTLAAALFVLIPFAAGFDSADTSRVMQGALAGIGFIGGGAILKLTSEREVLGLTTAADIWLASAIGMAAGLGLYALAFLGAAVALAALRLFVTNNDSPSPTPTDRPTGSGQTKN